MSSFDFTALIKFLTALFNAFMQLAEKLGFEMPDLTGGDDAEEGENTEEIVE